MAEKIAIGYTFQPSDMVPSQGIAKAIRAKIDQLTPSGTSEREEALKGHLRMLVGIFGPEPHDGGMTHTCRICGKNWRTIYRGDEPEHRPECPYKAAQEALNG
jgi:hypothetical protein